MPTPQEILKLPYERILIPEDEGGYSAYISEFDGCAADGETADEALSNLNESALAWVSAEQEAGRSIPEAWNLQEFSGKVLLRLPKSLHTQLARHASKDGVSLNQYVVCKLSEGATQDKIASMVSGLFQNRAIQIGQFFTQAETSSDAPLHLRSKGRKRQIVRNAHG